MPSTLAVDSPAITWHQVTPYARRLFVMTSHSISSRILRTALYVPASNRKAAMKAESLGADAVIFDLEDAVAPEQKQAARAFLAELPLKGDGLRVIRVNAQGTAWHDADLAAAVAAAPDALLFPKVNSREDIVDMRNRIAALKPQKPIALWAMIETPRGILNASEISQAVAPNGVLVLGLNDLAKETGMAQLPGRQPMLTAISLSVSAARAAGIAILDGVFNRIENEEGFIAECQQGKAFGLDGKSVIHPKQIAVANAVFGPTDSEIAEAQAIVDAFALPENAAKGVFALEGHMIERLHLAMAQNLLKKAERIKRND
jgi:citrate lyase subunit beta / citryl-CoA lyase